MSAEAANPEISADAKAAKAPKKKGKMIFIALGGLLIGGSALGGYTYIANRNAAAQTAQAEAEKKAAEKPAAVEKKTKTQVITLKSIIVNLRNTKGTRYLKCTIGMETASDLVAKELQSLSPQLSDFLIDKFSNVDMNDVDNTAGRNKLKREILTGTNELLENGYISAVYFTEFVVQ